MLAVESNTGRPVVAKFRPKPANISDGKGEQDIKNEMQIAICYRVLDQFDTLKNLRNGIYASKLITQDALYKTYEETDFNYETEYGNHFHTETGRDGVRETEKGILPKYVREGKSFTDFPESTLYSWTSTSYKHNDMYRNDMKEIVQRRLSQRLGLKTFKLELTVNGFTGVQSGDLISFEMPSYEPKTGSEPYDNDAYLSGRYLVTSVRHQINMDKKKHFMVLECMKDSVRKPYPEEVNDTFLNKEKKEEGIINVYDFDKIIYDGIRQLLK